MIIKKYVKCAENSKICLTVTFRSKYLTYIQSKHRKYTESLILQKRYETHKFRKTIVSHCYLNSNSLSFIGRSK